jgi:hypothetical protein
VSKALRARRLDGSDPLISLAGQKHSQTIPFADVTRALRLLPHVAQRPGSGVGLRTVGELAIEARGDRPAIEEPQFPASRQ